MLQMILDIIISVTNSALQASFQKTFLLNLLSSSVDSFGASSFVEIGVSTAQKNGYHPVTVWLSGIITTFVGGIISQIISGVPIRGVLSNNVINNVRTVIVTTSLYMAWIDAGIPPMNVKICIILLTGIRNVVLSKRFQDWLQDLVRQQQIFSIILLKSTVDPITFDLWQKVYIRYQTPKVKVSYPQPSRRPPYHRIQPAKSV